MIINNFSSARLLSQEKPRIVSKQEYKLETLLFLPPNYERKAEGGLRVKGYFKHSYKCIGNECLSVSNTESRWMLENRNELMADIFLETIAGDNIGYSNREKQEIDTAYSTDTRKWHICDTDGNPVKPAAMETQEKINEYIHGLSAETHEIPKNTEDKFMIFLPLITVITVVFNGVKTIEETIQSVVNQTYPNIEYIIIDGGSMDGTQNIIKKYGGVIDYWVSEPDKGIYDAMNKGISIATGHWVNFMNSGDKFYNKYIVGIIQNYLNADIVYGDSMHFDEKINNAVYKNIGKDVNKWNPKFCHQSLFEKKEWLCKYPFNLKYHVGADFNQYLECHYNKATRKYIPQTIAIFLKGGFSSQLSYFESIYEFYHIIKKYRPIYAMFYFFTRTIKSILMKMSGFKK